MELKQIKRNIWFILTIIGTSCGVIGGWFMCAVKGYQTGDWFLFWSGVATVIGMVYGLGIWTANLIIEIKRYIDVRKFEKGVYIFPKIKTPPDTMLLKVDKKEKGVAKNGTERNPKDTRPQ